MIPPPRLLVAVAIGGAAGAVLRHLLGELDLDGGAFPWTTFAINVVGATLLALVPAVAWIRRSATLTALVGPGVLGGFTTLSAYSEQTRGLLVDGQAALAAAYVVGTLVACLAGVALASRWTGPDEGAVEGQS